MKKRKCNRGATSLRKKGRKSVSIGARRGEGGVGGTVGEGGEGGSDPSCRGGGEVEGDSEEVDVRDTVTVEGHVTWIPGEGEYPLADQGAILVMQDLVEALECDVSSPRCQAWITSLAELVRLEPWGEEESAFIDHSLKALVDRCRRSPLIHLGTAFANMIELINLAMKAYRCALGLFVSVMG